MLSQAGEGWVALADRYDDGAVQAHMERGGSNGCSRITSALRDRCLWSTRSIA